MSEKYWVFVGSLSAAIAVAMGAFGAHALEGWLESNWPDDMEKRLVNWKTASTYQMFHSLGLIVVGLAAIVGNRGRATSIAGWAMLLGIIFFSGMLYAWVISGSKTLVMIVPIGGSLMIIGWLAMAVGALNLSVKQSALMKNEIS